MPLKNKTFIALTVKLVFAAGCLQAQQGNDSAQQKKLPFFSASSITLPAKKYSPLTQLPGNFYASHLPFFCTQELKVQKAVGMPIKFRVGSVAYCDKLEGKNR